MDHDLLFKELLTTFFFDFLDLFFPDVARGLDRAFGFIPMTQEIINDAALGEHREVDLLMRVKLRGRETDLLVHIENQATAQSDFSERMFRYFCYLTLRHSLPIYPVVLFSYDRPKRAEPSRYEVTFLDGPVLRFDYRVIQLNRLPWRDFLQRDNPVATALMAKMKIAREDRPKVKAELLRILASQRLDPARANVIWVFIERYLHLSVAETRVYDREVSTFTPREKETTMELMTSWGLEGLERGKQIGKEEGLQEGKQEGIHEGRETVVLRLLRRRLGTVPDAAIARVVRLTSNELEDLAEALLDFTSNGDLEQWLASRP